jgi:hypothetical protein
VLAVIIPITFLIKASMVWFFISMIQTLTIIKYASVVFPYRVISLLNSFEFINLDLLVVSLQVQ